MSENKESAVHVLIIAAAVVVVVVVVVAHPQNSKNERRSPPNHIYYVTKYMYTPLQYVHLEMKWITMAA